jgi:hypothetical protein
MILLGTIITLPSDATAQIFGIMKMVFDLAPVKMAMSHYEIGLTIMLLPVIAKAVFETAKIYKNYKKSKID